MNSQEKIGAKGSCVNGRCSNADATIGNRSIHEILCYFLPELITAIVTTLLLSNIDGRFVAHLKSTEAFAALSMTSTLFFLLHKIGEGLQVGTIIVCGRFQGKKEYLEVGRVATAALWITGIIGGIIALVLCVNADLIYHIYCKSDGIAVLGAPLLRIRAISIFFMFLYYALVGFLRGIKDTRSVMYFFVLGMITFVFFDYALIFGAWGFPALGLEGSAVAFVIQYAVMFLGAFVYIFSKAEYRPYAISWWTSGMMPHIRSICGYSWPILFDKASIQLEKVWLASLISPMGGIVTGAFGVIKDTLEALSLVPAVAFAQVVTLLTTNDYGAQNYARLKSTVKRIVLLSALMMAGILCALNFGLAEKIISLFDKQNAFTLFASQAFSIIGVLIFCDLLQLVLAGALRGTGNVQVVMWTRVLMAIGLFIPLSYAVSLIPFENPLWRLVALYATFNIVNGCAGVFYYWWFHTNRWYKNRRVTQ